MRLYPLTIAGALIATAFVLSPIGQPSIPGHEVVPAVTSAFTALPVLHIGSDGWRWPLNHPLWSLFWELVASVAFGLLLFRAHAAVLAVIALAAFAGLIVLIHRSIGLLGGLGSQGMLTAFPSRRDASSIGGARRATSCPAGCWR